MAEDSLDAKGTSDKKMDIKLMGVQGKTAVVTGGSRGIGKATAAALLEQECSVIICGKNKTNLFNAEKELKGISKNIFPFLCNLNKISDIKKFSSFVKNGFGSIDILINNAGVAYHGNFSDSKEAEINQTVDVNIRGLLLLTKYLLPSLNKGGLIVNISSGAGKHGFGGLAVYCASKFAVIGFTQSLAQELEDIKVISVCPGGVDTDMYAGMSTHRPGLKPEHVAAKILDICLSLDNYKTGSSVNVYHVTDALNYLRMRYFKK